MAGQNTSQFLGGSILSAVSLEGCCIFKTWFLGVTVGMIVTVGFFIIMDWWTGSAASHTKLLLETKGIWIRKAQNKKHQNYFTIYFLYTSLAHSLLMAVENGFVTRATEL
jgi:hypothetical protein